MRNISHLLAIITSQWNQETSKRFDLQEGRAERQLLLDMLENRPALALSFVFIVYLHYMGLAVSTIIVKCRSKLFLSSVLFNTFMQKHKDRRGLGWAPVLTKSRQLKPSHARDWATVASLVVWAKWPINRNASEDKHCLMKEFFVWKWGLTPLICVKGNLTFPLLPLSHSRSSPTRQGQVRETVFRATTMSGRHLSSSK